MVAKARQSVTDSTKAADWEIDTSAPFESVKAAVSLFGEGAFSAGKPALKKPRPPAPPSIEKPVAKETQLQLAQKELHKYKEQLQNAETTKAQALDELEKVRKAASDLAEKLNATNKLKEFAIKAAEMELAETTEHYVSITSELDGAKQELRRMSEEFSALMNGKAAATQEAADASQCIEASTERARELTKQITAASDSLAHVKHAHMQAMQEQADIMKSLNEKSSVALQQTQKKLEALRKEISDESDGDLETKWTAKMAEVGSMQKRLDLAKASHMKSDASISTDLNEAKGTLRKVAEEEEAQRSLLDSLKIELENVRKELQDLEEKEAEAETIAADLHLKLQKAKTELNMALAVEAKAKSDELVLTLKQLSSESEEAKAEADKVRQKTEELKREAETTRDTLEDVEKRLKVALVEAEAAKAAEANALNLIKPLSGKTNAACSSTSEHGPDITISKEEYDSLNSKVNGADTLAGMKVAAAMAQVEAIRASEKEAEKKLESMRNEIEEIQAVTEETLKKAEMAEAARNAVEGELKRWREREQKRWPYVELPPRAPIDQNEDDSGKVNIRPTTGTEKANWPEKAGSNSRKMERSSTLKKLLLPSLSGIFLRKKNQVEGGMPSYLPGEKVM